MAAYNPDSRSFRLASLLVAHDKRPDAPAMFVHGSCVRDDGLDDAILQMAVGAYRSGSVGQIVINGISDEVCQAKTLAYPGAETWTRKLAELDVQPIAIAASPHTPAEVRNMIALAGERGWDGLIVAAFPHHLLRVMCQWVYLLKEVGSPLRVYARTMDTIDWDMPAMKPLLGGGTVGGTLIDLVDDEISRLCMYADVDGAVVDGVRKFTPNATLEELIEYYSKRDLVATPA